MNRFVETAVQYLHIPYRAAEREPSPVVQTAHSPDVGVFKKWENLRAALALHFAYLQVLPGSPYDRGSGNRQQRTQYFGSSEP